MPPNQLSPQRLLSPIQLSPSQSSPKPRQKPTSRSPRRRRPLARVDCQLESPPHFFDQLPWISALEAIPDSTSPWDIADLSQIPDPFPRPVPASSPGPVRRRKSSLRSNPLALPPAPTPSSQFQDDLYWAPGSTLPFCDAPIACTQTPPPRFTPSRVLFHNLMPVYNDQSDNCTLTLR
jgi:hypothetical protein